MQTVKDFSNLFIDGNIDDIIEGYAEFQKEAIQNPDRFEILHKHLSAVRFQEQWKENVYEKFSWLLNICKRYQDEGLEYARDELNECMNSFIIDPIKYISGKPEWMADLDIRYQMLYLMLDIIYAYSDEKRNLHFSAVVWHKLSDMGKCSLEIRNFYERADIVNYALNTLSIKYKVQNLDTIVREVRYELNNNFSRDFCQHLLSEIQSERKIYKDNSTTFTTKQEDIPTLEKAKNKKRQTDWFVVFYMIVLLLIALLIGVLIGSALDIGNLGMSNSKRVIEEQKAEIQSLNTEIRELKNEIRELNRELYKKNTSDVIGGADSTEDQKETEIESETEDTTQETESETEEDNNNSGIHTGTSRANN